MEPFWIVKNLWLIPGLPIGAALVITFLGSKRKSAAFGLSVGCLALSAVLSFWAFSVVSGHEGISQNVDGSAEIHQDEPEADSGEVFRETHNFTWISIGYEKIEFGWVLDPLTAVMIAMVSFVALLIFIYSGEYMKQDPRFTRFFAFLSLFTGSMLGVVISNSFLLFFIFWELVGLSSYLLIGFWYHKPSAVAASQKAFLVTRIGDFGLLIGMILLTSSAGNFLFYDEGKGCLEDQALNDLLGPAAIGGLTVSGLISLLVFIGAMSKSGQVPFHVWLPDAMEGPTPVSALIHAATMVAAGVFLVARLFPLFDLDPAFVSGVSPALSVVTWVGAITAFYAACVAVAQTDIKRILAYSTISQLGYMMMALGVGGVAAGMFHLITHAFFKALLFLGAGSVIHGSHDEQDIRKMGGLRTLMPKTFLVYAIGMLALTGFPFLFSGFWSKEEILTTAWHWPASKIPFLLGLCGAFLTAFYMSRQMIYVFHGENRQQSGSGSIHESPGSMVIPMAVLAAFAVGLSVIGTPIWPWFEGFITGHPVPFQIGELFHLSHLALMVVSTALVFGGYFLAWKIYGSAQSLGENHPDRLSSYQPWFFGFLNRECHVDELYQKIFVKPLFDIGQFCRTVEEKWNFSLTSTVSAVTLMISWCCRWVDDWLINPGFDYICDRSRRVAERFSALQNGEIQNYLRVGGLAIAFLMVIYVLGGMI